MPIPQDYYRELIERYAAAEREARRDTLLEWFRVLGEIVLWTLIGLVLIGVAFYVADVQTGRIWWYGGAAVWVAGVSTAILTGYKRGEDRGDW